MNKNLKGISMVAAVCISLCSMIGLSTNTVKKVDAASRTKKTLTIGIYSQGRKPGQFAPNEYPDDNWSTHYIINKFGKPNNINVKFELIDDTNDAGTQNMQILMAAHKAPDLFYVNVGDVSFVHTFAEAGGLANLQPSLDKYGSHIKKLLGTSFIKKYGTFYKKTYAIPGQEPIPAISHYWIRQDWLDALHLKMPTNFDEWYSVMKAFKKRAPELEKAGLVKNAKDVVPYQMYHTKYFTDWERIVARFYPTKYFDENKAEYYVYSGYGTEYLKKGFKEGMQFMNKMYNDGLINKNFALDEDQKQFERNIVSGNVGSYCNNLFSGWEPSNSESWFNLVKKNIPKAKYEWCDTFTNKYDKVARNPLDNPVLTYCVVPSYSKVLDEAVKYLDWVATGNNMITLQYGELNKSYTMDSVLGPMMKDEKSLKTWGHLLGGRDLVMIGRLPDRKWSRIQRSRARTKEEAEYAEKIHLGIEKNGYERFPGILSAAQEKSLVGGLRTPWQKFVANLIMAEPGEFNSTWDEGTKELEANGSLKVVAGYKKLVKQKLGLTVK